MTHSTKIIPGSRYELARGSVDGATYKTQLQAGIDRFNAPLFGGFDGFDITKPDPLYNKGIGTSERNSYVHYSIKRAIDTVAERREARSDAIVRKERADRDEVAAQVAVQQAERLREDAATDLSAREDAERAGVAAALATFDLYTDSQENALANFEAEMTSCDNAEITDLEGPGFGMVHVAGACAIAGIMGALGFHVKPRLVFPAGASAGEEEGLSVPFNV